MMDKKSLPIHPLVDWMASRSSSVAEASTELALHQEVMAGACAITVEQFGRIRAILSVSELPNGEVPPSILDAQKDIMSHANDPAHLERLLAEAFPNMLYDAEQIIINIENIRGDLSPETIANRAFFFNSCREIMAAILSSVRKEKALQALAVVMDGLKSLEENPIVMDAPWVSDFMTRLAADIGRSIDPHEVIASVAKTNGATKAANIRHAASAEIRLRVAKEWEQRKSKNPKLSKNKAAEDIAPLAIAWNIELDAKLLTLTTEEKAKAQVRDWLKERKTAI
ncbi:MAG: hypothetical protein PHG39_09665 [Acidithiobacillus ferrooxidans]|uniref:Uncharacterized protein n=1 Tax=Acidithiobacillus ferruginosus TaxID=3063951 RepID=A0ACD5IIU1_9PROT|nr:hypothetical protein [Acidithiobacillus ferruginosus]MDD2747805.1 hypothetical protein [Acidithiobacillus ferrooxidans]MDD5002755.1 hypothetical protein [Acidithiobacillus sp.]MBU2813104.1 hypothetical protein [Acidithiobacillus ferruginosus]MDD5377983.1 hypothetical protein [Acidithiobacillus sp.]MDD5576204.1 hypothetical protein [Acidithiobacillus sp.]